jgi:glycogen operon protein
MLLMGDELGRSQAGNNNVYCQDNELSWMDWETADEGLIDFTAKLIALRKAHPVLRKRRYMHGNHTSPAGIKDVTWLHPEGREMAGDDWHEGLGRCLGVMICGRARPDIDGLGRPYRDSTLLILCNAAPEPRYFELPERPVGIWTILVDSTEKAEGRKIASGAQVALDGRYLLVLEHEDRGI